MPAADSTLRLTWARPRLEMTDEVEQRPPARRRKWLKWVLIAIVAVVLAPFALTFAYYGVAILFAGCSDAEEAALAEFPQYGGIHAEPDGDIDGGCRVDLNVDDPPGDVIAYYREQLTGHGWTLDDSGQPQGETAGGESLQGGGGAFESGDLIAHRDDLFYSVSYEALEGSTITLVIHVSGP
jgi:hypothetical protein